MIYNLCCFSSFTFTGSARLDFPSSQGGDGKSLVSLLYLAKVSFFWAQRQRLQAEFGRNHGRRGCYLETSSKYRSFLG